MAEKKGAADVGPGGKNTLTESVADFARREMSELEDRERKKQQYWEGQRQVVEEIPVRFWKMVEQIRTEIETFNKIVDPTRRISLNESAGLAARADHRHHELNLTITRKGAEAWVGLSELMRLGRAPAAFIIEGHVRLSQGRVRVRSEGIAREGKLRFRVTIDGQEAPFSIDELGSRVVLAVAKDDPQVLGAPAQPV